MEGHSALLVLVAPVVLLAGPVLLSVVSLVLAVLSAHQSCPYQTKIIVLINLKLPFLLQVLRTLVEAVAVAVLLLLLWL